jgi:Flp pilus assembly protein protease CpaA
VWWLLWSLLILCSVIIAYQDFKDRLISLWLIFLFTAVNVGQYLYENSIYQFIENTIFCVCYFLITFLIIFLFYYLRTGKREKIMDSKIGWGDVLLFLSIGFCIEPVTMVYFFTVSFIIALGAYCLFFRSKSSIPLAGLLSSLYSVFVLIMKNAG